MDSLASDHTLTPKNALDAPELETLLPRQFKTIHRTPLARTIKDYTFLEEDIQRSGEMSSEKSQQGTLTKDSGYFNSDVSDMIRRLQAEVESLRERVSADKHDDSGGRIYETIDPKKRSSTPAAGSTKTNGRERSGETRDTIAERFRNRGFHRLSYVCDSESHVCKRCIWLLLILCCLALLGFNLRDRLMLFFTYPINVDIQLHAVDSLEFPDVTICNLNTYRLTKTVSLGVYDVIQTAESPPYVASGLRRVEYIKKYGYIGYETFLRNVSHDKRDFIHSCTWRGRKCQLSDFLEVITHQGICYKFQATDRDREIVSTDNEAGLSVVLNVEQYEYILGPRSAVGVTVFVHEPRSTLSTYGVGVHAAVGSFTSLAIRKTQHSDLGHPYGNCRRSTEYNRGECLSECQTTHLLRMCGCYMPYQQKKSVPEQYRACNVKDYFACVANATKSVDGKYPLCDCDDPCERVEYGITMSTASTSVYASESFMRSVKNFEELEQRFRRARDTYHKVDDVIFSYDTQALTAVTDGLSRADKNVSTFVAGLTVYDDTYEKKLSEIFDAVKNLNVTTSRFYGAFKGRTHVTFVAEDNTLVETVTKISEKAKIDDFASKTEEAINSTIVDIMNQLDLLIISRKYEYYSAPSVVEEITQGIKSFDDKLMKGFGQLYREFRDDKTFYEGVIKRVLSLTDELTKNIRATQRRMLLISEKRPLKSNEVQTSLLGVSRDTKRILDITAKALVEELNKLHKKYKTHVSQILELSRTLVNIGSNFSGTVDTIKALLNSTQSIARLLRSRIASLKSEIVTIREEYVEGSYGKSKLIEKITSRTINMKLAELKTHITQAKNRVQDIQRAGDKLANSVEPIKSRIVDFKFINAGVMSSLFDWLRFPSVQKEYNTLLSTIGETTKLISQFQSDLEDYNTANTISSEFYQNNFLQLEVAFPDMSVTSVRQHVSYGLFDLACDVGGIMALFLGASILTCIELIFVLGQLCGRGGDKTPGYERRLGTMVSVEVAH